MSDRQAAGGAQHCMHLLGDDEHRVCCWCALGQTKTRHHVATHGPHLPYSHYDWTWEPSSLGWDCQRVTVEHPDGQGAAGRT